MRKEATTLVQPYYNEFEDLTEVVSLKNRLRLKNANYEGIKIANPKLPAGFFRPHTCEKPSTNDITMSQCGMKTPSFGEFKKESISLSIILKNKSPTELFSIQGPSTFKLPKHQTIDIRQEKNKKSVKRALTENKDYQVSHREHKIKRRVTLNNDQISNENWRRNKLTIDTEVFLQEKKGIKIEYGNEFKLNIKRFFRDEVEQEPVLAETFLRGSRAKSKKLPPLI